METIPGRLDAVAAWLEGRAEVRIPAHLGARCATATWIEIPPLLHRLWRAFDVQCMVFDPCGAMTLVGRAPEETAMALDDALRVRPVAEGADLSRPQRTAMDLAVSLGYYEVPRRVGLRALAAHMGLSHGAVSELLRRAEQQVITGHCDQSLQRAVSTQT